MRIAFQQYAHIYIFSIFFLNWTIAYIIYINQNRKLGFSEHLLHTTSFEILSIEFRNPQSCRFEKFFTHTHISLKKNFDTRMLYNFLNNSYYENGLMHSHTVTRVNC